MKSIEHPLLFLIFFFQGDRDCVLFCAVFICLLLQFQHKVWYRVDLLQHLLKEGKEALMNKLTNRSSIPALS